VPAGLARRLLPPEIEPRVTHGAAATSGVGTLDPSARGPARPIWDVWAFASLSLHGTALAGSGPMVAERQDDRDVSSPRFGAAARTLLIWATGVACVTALTAAGIISLHRPTSDAAQLGQRALPSDLALRDTVSSIMQGETLFIAALQTQDPAARGSAISAAQDASQAASGSWLVYKSHALNRPGETASRQAYEAAAESGGTLGARLVSMSSSDPTYATTLAEQRRASDAQVAAITKLESTVYAPLVQGGAQNVSSGIARARTTVLEGFGLLLMLFTVVAFALVRGARRDQRATTREAEAMRTAQEQAKFDAALQRALEMAPSEDAAVDVVRKALEIVAADTPAEILLADSSHAHLRQVLSTHPAADASCLVGLPRECPAASDGHTRIFDSTHLDACRFLSGRVDPVWAVCVPVSIAGRATGVIHTQQRLDRPFAGRLPADLEVVARKTGDRLGALRVLARTEAQAQTDPLTGLPNRRTLDTKTYDLLADGTAFVVAYADLDHFKSINDTFGHDTGDRALRVFARVLRDSVRPEDLVARHGGEEFLLVLPDCSLSDARAVAERVRTDLAKALAQAAVPPFTVTIGLAASEPGDAFSEVVARADATMLKAKELGRDRVLATPDVTADTTRPASANGEIRADARVEPAPPTTIKTTADATW